MKPYHALCFSLSNFARIDPLYKGPLSLATTVCAHLVWKFSAMLNRITQWLANHKLRLPPTVQSIVQGYYCEGIKHNVITPLLPLQLYYLVIISPWYFC